MNIAFVLLILISISAGGLFYIYTSRIHTGITTKASEVEIIPEIAPKVLSLVCYPDYAKMRISMTKGGVLRGDLVYEVKRGAKQIAVGTASVDIEDAGDVVIPSQFSAGESYRVFLHSKKWSIFFDCVAVNYTNLVLFLPFREGSGNVARDASGNGNDASVNADWVNGTTDYALRFDGSSQYAEVSNSPEINPDTFSLYFWVLRETHDADEEGVIEKRDSNSGFSVRSMANGDLKFSVLSSGTEYSITLPLQDTTWTNFLFVFNSTHILVYRNCTLASTAPASFTPSSSNLLIGKGSSGYFNGAVDEVKFFRVPLTPDEVNAYCPNYFEVQENAYDGTWEGVWV